MGEKPKDTRDMYDKSIRMGDFISGRDADGKFVKGHLCGMLDRTVKGVKTSTLTVKTDSGKEAIIDRNKGPVLKLSK